MIGTVNCLQIPQKILNHFTVLHSTTLLFYSPIYYICNNIEKLLIKASAINATQVEVKFGAPVSLDSVFTSGLNNTAIKPTNFVFTAQDSQTKPTAPLGKLSEDGKTLVITANDNNYQKKYNLEIKDIKSKDGKDIERFIKIVDFGEDKVAPTILSVDKVTSGKFEVKYSEPVNVTGANWTFKDADGKTVAKDSTHVQVNVTDDMKTVITLGTDIVAGTKITGTVIGATDKAGNLLNPNPATITITKGAKDGVRPEVAAVTPLGLDKFEIKFSEELANLAVTDIEIDDNALVATNGTNGAKLEQDKNDKTKYTVILEGTAKVTAGLHKVEIAENKVSDLSGEGIKAFSQLVNFKADTVAPKFVSSKIVENDDKEEVLVLTFDKEVDTLSDDFDTLSLDATELDKNLITTTGNLEGTGTLTQNADNKKQLEVALKDLTFNNGTDAAYALKKDAKYTVEFAEADVIGVNAIDVEAFEVEFVRGTDGTPVVAAPKVNTAVATNPDTITVTFDKAVDGSTATNASNYSIPGLVIEKATLKAASGGTQNVVLTLKKNTNTQDGSRNLTIKNVKAKDGEAMTTVTKVVADMKENVRPTVESAKFTGVTGGEVDKITVTFSEDVLVDADSFELYIGDSKTKVANVTTDVVSGTAKDKTVINIATNLLTTEDIAKGITVKLADGKDVKDVNGNVLDFTSTKATY